MNIINNPYALTPNQHYTSPSQFRYSEKLANYMPNGMLRVAETQPNKNMLNNFSDETIKRMYSPKLAPSAGSLTENFLKARSNNAPLYKHNEASTKYEMVSMSPIFLKQIKRNIDLVV